jgi:hypothetical protein
MMRHTSMLVNIMCACIDNETDLMELLAAMNPANAESSLTVKPPLREMSAEGSIAPTKLMGLRSDVRVVHCTCSARHGGAPYTQCRVELKFLVSEKI